ncbi:MAG: hypothetical protein GY820_13390 [Gammaproteobacteria bacterium]|nr:hypothetical protein [Gammaproteobacteria bacterium]
MYYQSKVQYNKGKEKLDDVIDLTEKLVSDNPTQVKRIILVRQLVNEWLEKAGKIEIEARRKVREEKKDDAYSQAILSQNVGKEILDRMRIILNQLSDSFIQAQNREARILVSNDNYNSLLLTP